MFKIKRLLAVLFFYFLPVIAFCISIEDCKTQDGDKCIECNDGYTLYNSECYPCDESCKTCFFRGIDAYPPNDPGDCMSCYDGFYESEFVDYPYGGQIYYSGYCEPCGIDNCKECELIDETTKCNKCLPKFYLNSGQCSPCHDSCLECSGSNNNECTSCPAGFGLQETAEGKFCKQCPNNCLECDKDLKCTKCNPDSYSDLQGICQKCDQSCDGCHNGGNDNCIKCKEGFYNQNGLCLKCDESCKTCETTSTQCTDCKDGFYLTETTCTACSFEHCNKCTSMWCEKCEDGYYVNSNSGCSQCDSSCLTCSGDSEKCTQCQHGYYPSFPGNGFSYCSPCILPCLSCTSYSNCQLCSAGYYVNNGACKSCGDNCLHCDNNGKCQECSEGYYLNENSCVQCPGNCKNCTSSGCSECYDGYFVLGNGCSECGTNCNKCTDQNTCTECKKKFYVNDEKSCSPCNDPNCDGCNVTHCYDCIPEYYPQDGVCQKCSTVCSECDGPTESDCLDCDPGYYFSRTSRRCFKCNEACELCDGPNDYNCTKCAKGYFLDEDSEILPNRRGKRCTKCEFGCLECTSLTECITCKDGYTKSGYDDCKKCPDGCKTCLALSLECESCLPGFYSVNKENGYVLCNKCPGNCADCTLSGDKIICNKCSNGYYADSNGNCVQCTLPCTSCSSATVCTSCAEGYLLKDNKCDTQCNGCLTCVDTPDTCSSCYEGSSLKGKTCEYCGYGCKTCDFQKDSAVCTSCLDGFYLEEGQCQQCSPECETCFKYGSAFCFACKKGYFKQNEYSNPVPYRGLCTPCNAPNVGLSHCSECTSFCSDDLIGHGGECTFSCTNCDDGFYLSDDGKTCFNCDTSCNTCYGGSPNQCKTCHDGEYLQDDTCHPCFTNCNKCTNSSICVQCNIGYQTAEGGTKCEKIPCTANCELCDTRSCLQCEEEYGPVWDNDIIGFKCRKCSQIKPNCRTCEKNSQDQIDCKSCELGFYLNAGYCNLCKTNCEVCDDGESCRVCKAGYFVSGKECQKCTNNCATCSGTSDYCTSCSEGFHKVDNTCQACPSNCKECTSEGCSICNEHYFVTPDKKCEQCGSNCLECSDKDHCTRCELHYYPDEQGTCQSCGDNCDICSSKTQCKDCIPEYYVSTDGSCQKCAEVCHECDGPTENDCLDCDPGYYFSRPNRKCFKCHEGCSNCTGPNDYECSNCSTGYFMSKEEIEVLPDVFKKVCIRCEKGCAECVDAHQCTVCKGGFYLVDNNGDMDCEACEKGCNKCDSGSTKCTECSEGYYVSERYEETLVRCTECPTNCKTCSIQSDTITCSNCFDGFYENAETHTCDSCQYPCATCSSSATTCLSCLPGLLLKDNKCDESCNYPCMTCIDNPDNCISCYESFIPSNATCIQCPEGCKTCEKSGESFVCLDCKDGYYKDGEQCSKCVEPCSTCFNKNTYRCYSCIKGYYMDKIYTDPIPYAGKCELCNSKAEHCLECSTECIDDDLDSYKTCHNFKCSKCEGGYFITEENGQSGCSPCPENCLTCSDSTTCTQCNEGYLLKDEGKTCEKIPCSSNCEVCDTRNCLQCNDGYGKYWDNDAVGMRCKECSQFQLNCKLCEGESESVKCTQCESGYFPNVIGACAPCPTNCEVCDDGESCRVCKAGYFVSGKECQKCTNNCATCSGTSDYCTSCSEGFHKVDNTCQACPSNCKECTSEGCSICNEHYFVTPDKKCEQCGSNCLECSDKEHCTRCELHYYPDEQGTCQICGDNCDICSSKTQCKDCIPEYYVSTDGSCQKCAEVCHECDGPTENDCLDCDPGYYFSRPNRKCFKCHEGCSNCTGPNDYECSNCSTGYFMSEGNTQILPGINGKKCTRCEKGCAECVDAHQCTVCKGGFYLVDNNGDMDCEACEKGCNKCDSGSTKCTECSEGYYVSERYEETLVRCTECPTNCKTCSIQSDTITCSNCFDGFYENADTHTCDSCKYPCATCSSSATTCLSCADNHLLQGNSCNTLCAYPCMTCKDKADSCVTCYDEYVPSGSTCIKCPEGCKTCEKVDDSFVCLDCIDGYYKDKEQCISCNSPCSTCFNSFACYTCEKGYYINTISTFPAAYTATCALCSDKLEHCSQCSTECIDDDLDTYKPCGNFKCSNCDGGFFLTEENGQQKCSSCPENCYKCTDSTTCKQCNQGYILNGTVCEVLGDFCSNGRCELDNTNATYYQNVTLSVETLPPFVESNNTESGGAVRLINSGLTCINLSFTSCKSQKAGGGIYIYNNIETEDETITYSIVFTGLTFDHCEAKYGAAVFIYSPSNVSPVKMLSCTFVSNQLTSSSNTEKFYGGSALYIVSRNAEVIDCSFSHNKGRGGAVKISDDFSVVPDGLRILQRMSNYSQGSIFIIGCSFEISEDADSSLFYDNEKRLTKVEIRDCSFNGKLNKDAHHIDGISIDDQKSNIIINSCKFASDQDGALNNKFIKIDLRNQVLFNNKYVKLQLNSKFMLTITSLAAVLVIVITIVIKKQNNNASETENKDSIEV